MASAASSTPPVATPPTVLVLGASGLTGTEVVRELADAKVPIRVSYREASELSVLRNFGVEMFYVDYHQIDSVQKSMQGIDTVILILPVGLHLANWGMGIVDAASEMGVRHFIYESNVVAGQVSDAEISRSHRKVEMHLKKAELDYTIVRPAPYYQNMLWSSIAIMRQGRFSLPLENAKIPHIDMRDVAQALAKIALAGCDAHAGATYHITGGEALSMFDIARIISRQTGKSVRYSPTPLKSAYQLFRNFGWTEPLSKLVADMHIEYVGFDWKKIRNNFAGICEAKPRTFRAFVDENKVVFAGHDAAPPANNAQPSVAPASR